MRICVICHGEHIVNTILACMSACYRHALKL